MEPNQMFTVGLVPSQQLVSLLTDNEGNWRDVPQGQSVVPLVKIPKPEQGAWEPTLVWFDDRVERQWVEGTPVPPPAISAESHLEASGFSSLRLVALLDLESKLAAAQKTSSAMTAARAWIDGILAAYAQDQSPRSDWPLPPVSFESAVAGAVAALQSNSI